MRDNLFGDSKPSSLTKKFWSYVKSSSKSSRIPDRIYHNNVHATDDIREANSFNTFLFEQFFAPSEYKIEADVTNDHYHDFQFDAHKICNILKCTNINKSPGPDDIAGIILKNCALILSYPLSILFDISFSTGQLPSDWKSANVVPIHKKVLSRT